jgi:hypothetical protein
MQRVVSVEGSPERADWLRGAGFDLALVVGVLALSLTLGGVAMMSPRLFGYVLWFDIAVLAYPHVTSTYTRFAFDRESARRHWFLLSGLPLLVLAALSGIAALGGAGALFTAYYVGQTYHYTRQSYGIARIYRRKGGEVSANHGLLTDSVVYAFPVWGLLQRAHEAHDVFYDNPLLLPRVPAVVANLAGGVACALFAAWAFGEVRAFMAGSRRWGHALFVLSHVAVTVVSYLVVRDVTSGWLIVNLWHNAQYLLFVWAFNVERFRAGPDPQRRFLSTLCQPRNVWAYAIFCLAFGGAIYATLGGVGALLPVTAFPALLVLHLCVNFHHYLVDGVIWKSPKRAAAQQEQPVL